MIGPVSQPFFRAHTTINWTIRGEGGGNPPACQIFPSRCLYVLRGFSRLLPSLFLSSLNNFSVFFDSQGMFCPPHTIFVLLMNIQKSYFLHPWEVPQVFRIPELTSISPGFATLVIGMSHYFTICPRNQDYRSNEIPFNAAPMGIFAAAPGI